MDVTTHATVAAFTAVGLARGKVGSKEIWTAVFLGSMAPDIDALLYLFHPHFYFEYHRTYTHTLLGIAILSAVTAGLITLSWGQRSFLSLYLYALFGGLIHLGLDTLTRYPLHPLAPFSPQNYAVGLFGWRDPFFKTAALIGIGLILILPRFLARPLVLLGFLVMAGRVALAYFLRR
ncbi:MAG: metal-dependent hydrolase [Candidatus Methylomirabilales bacterium]